MNIAINKTELLDVLGTVGKYAGTTIACLGCVLVTADADGATFEATNLNESARCRAAALVQSEGAALLPVRKLTEIVKSMPDAAVTIDAGNGSATVTCGKSKFAIPALDPDDFPGVPKVEPDSTVEMPFDAYQAMVHRCLPFVSKNANTPIVTGILMESGDGMLRMVATDSYRMICDETEFVGRFREVLPPALAANTASMKSAGQTVMVSSSEGQMVVKVGDSEFVSRKLEGNYPKWEALLPKESTTTATFDRSDMAAIIRRAMAASGGKHPCQIDVGDGIAFKVEGGEDGSFEESMECLTDGRCTIKGNTAYLAAAVSSVNSDDCKLSLTNPLKPLMFEGGTVKVIVMPVR